MAKSLADIVKGVKFSKTSPGSTGKDPGVDYASKAPAEQDLVAKHGTEKHADRVGNGDDIYQATNVRYALDDKTKEPRHGHKKGDDKKVYEAKKAEDAQCNHSPKGTVCPVHGIAECMTVKSIKEEELDEVLTKSTTAGETIHDFVHSDNPKFAGKSKEKRKQMALAAYYAKQRNEETELDEGHYHVSWGPGIEHSLIAKHPEDAVAKAKAHIIKKVPKLTEPKYADTFSKKPHVHRIKEDLAVPLLGGDIAKSKTNDTDDEISMVKSELKALADKSMHLVMQMPTNMHIEPWVQAKIAAAKEMISSVHDHCIYGDHSKPEEDETTYTPMTFPNMANDSAAGINV